MENRLKLADKIDKYEPPFEIRWFVQTLISEEVKGNKLEAEKRTGVSRGKFYYYFNKYPEFRKWFSEQCEIFLAKNEAIPSFMLMKKILDGDVQAIRTYYELAKKLRGYHEFKNQISIITLNYGHRDKPVISPIRAEIGHCQPA